MSSPATADDLITLVRKSGLIDETKLTAFLQSHQKDGSLNSDGRKLAGVLIRDGLLTYFQAEQFMMGKWRGFTLGKFKLLERIGFGGMGQVFLCEHMFMRKRMAVKVLPPNKAEDPVTLGRFYREARVASGLEHPNIVRTFDIDQDGPLHFLVMEYVDGTTIYDIVKKFGPLSVARAASYIRMSAMGLQYAHTQGTIHCDIKPGNIIVSRGGVAKILDMGLARSLYDAKDQITVKFDDKSLLGTADYVAPEQTRDRRNNDIRTDIYGMGATFYFSLTGQPPFPEGSITDKIIAHQSKKPKPIRDIRPDVPQGIARIIEKMMAKDPADRYQTPQEVVDALEPWTQTPIELPSAEEMPKLSPAATEQFTSRAAMPAQTPRPEVASKSRPPSNAGFKLPEMSEAAFESAATIPVPTIRPSKPNSVVDLMLPAGQTPTPPVARFAPPLPSEHRASATPDSKLAGKPSGLVDSKLAGKPSGLVDSKLAGKPSGLVDSKLTAQRPALTDTPRPPSLPELDFPKLPPELSRLGPSRVPGIKPKPPSGEQLKTPPVQGTKPPSGDGLRTPLADLETPRPGPEPSRRFPSLRDALRGSAVPDLSKPPTLESFRIPPPDAAKPAGPTPLSPSRDLVRGKGPASQMSAVWTGPGKPPSPITLPEPPRPATTAPVGRAPVYRPPTMMPFFDQPVMLRQPSVIGKLLRWTLMTIISVAIGAGLGFAIWYQFMRN